jgi:hypothetical protein
MGLKIDGFKLIILRLGRFGDNLELVRRGIIDDHGKPSGKFGILVARTFGRLQAGKDETNRIEPL